VAGSEVLDAVIIGGGPAGLSAALVLGRCVRRVAVCDSGQYRNARSTALHCFMSRDGIAPSSLLEETRRASWRGTRQYPSVAIRSQPRFTAMPTLKAIHLDATIAYYFLSTAQLCAEETKRGKAFSFQSIDSSRMERGCDCAVYQQSSAVWTQLTHNVR
jgi:cation diffusion facilitator CzcD-associated flavoprotein CzcO